MKSLASSSINGLTPTALRQRTWRPQTGGQQTS